MTPEISVSPIPIRRNPLSFCKHQAWSWGRKAGLRAPASELLPQKWPSSPLELTIFAPHCDHFRPSNWPFSPIKMTSLRRNVQSEYWIGHTRFFRHLSVRDCAREDLWKSTQHLSTLPYTHWQDIGVGIRACLPQFFFAPRSIFLPPMPFATTKRTFHETYVTL